MASWAAAGSVDTDLNFLSFLELYRTDVVQCRAPASRGKTKCRFHGGASTGPKTEQGRQCCVDAKTIHGNETRKARTERADGMRRLRGLEDLGYALGIMAGPRMPGRKPVKSRHFQK